MALALLLWLFYFGALKIARAAFALALTGDALSDVPDAWYSVPTALSHVFALYVAYRALSGGGDRPVLAVVKGEWLTVCRLVGRAKVKRPRAFAFALMFTAGMLVYVLAILTQVFIPPTSGPTKAHIAEVYSLGSSLLFAFLATLTAPVIEELFYRGYLMQQLRLSAGPVAAVLLVTVLFASTHIGQYSDAAGNISWPSVCSVAVTGAAFALLRLGTGSLVPGVVAHALLNCLAVLTTVLSTHPR